MIIVFSNRVGEVCLRRHEVGNSLRGMRLEEVRLENYRDVRLLMENPKWVATDLIPAMKG